MSEDISLDQLRIVMRGIVLVALILALAGFGGCYYTTYAPLRDGFCQNSVPGVAGYVWVKCP